MTTTLREAVKKTGYQDIDELLIDTHNLLKESDQLQKDIETALRFKPVNPNSIRTMRGGWIKRFVRTNR